MKPVLIAMCGLMGTGKSTMAAELSERTGFTLLRSDEVRKELAGLHKEEHRHEEFGEGMYGEAYFHATYSELFDRAASLLDEGSGVIIDASFKKEIYRAGAKEVAVRKGVPFLLIECVCPDNEVKRRLQERERLGEDLSDGRWDIFQRQKSDFETVNKKMNEKEYLVIDTSEEGELNIARILQLLEAL